MAIGGGEENGNRSGIGVSNFMSNFHPSSKIKCKRMDSDATKEALPSNDTNHDNTRKFVFICAIFASLNSVLLGYDVGIMSGAILFIQEDLKISEVHFIKIKKY